LIAWLMIAAGSSFAAAPAARPNMSGLMPDRIVDVAKERALDFQRLEELGIHRALSFSPGMIVHQDVGPNATVGLGLASMYRKKKAGSDSRFDSRPARSRRPAITFVVKF
jgi:hypothetical protein